MTLFWKLMNDGGPIMWLILLAAVLGMYIFFRKTFQFHREEVNVRELMKGLVNVLKRDGFVEAISLCDNTPGPAARVLTAAIMAYEQGDEDVQHAIDDSCLEEMPKLEAGLNFLGTIGFVAPLLGLLGTVLGMMKAFQTIHDIASVYLSAEQLAGSINMALITTAAGLAVAIPCYVAYNYLVERVNSISLDMEKAASEILYFFNHHQRVARQGASTAAREQR
ncbi:MAG: MotA/TolQ/ExbB proton channel family protein [Victivallaceae bacterium]|nr:MotA/TolQ/ExbB proton channel family protein [Victivallaceae bacterium]